MEEAIAAYADGAIGLHAPIRVRYGKMIDGKMEYRLINATVGRLIYNEPIPQDLGFVDRTGRRYLDKGEYRIIVGKQKVAIEVI